jgi:DNA-binding GntR family transcriptional regulator
MLFDIQICMQSLETGGSKNSGSLHEEVLSKLRQMILEGELEPGSRIVERSLCERFKVSRTPLREAFKVLRSEGLVEILPNRGARVPTFGKKEICDALEIMTALEGLAGELAAERAPDDVIADIRALHYQMFAHYLRAQVPEYFRLNQSIHRRIVEAAGNHLLTANHDALALRVMRARYLMNLWDHTRWADAIRSHEAILDALVRRSGAELGQLLRQHLHAQTQRVVDHFNALEEQSRRETDSAKMPANHADSSPEQTENNRQG